ncbi:hypothetical protein AB837_00464 [bacterium AB1]|nr:hypothetical protein AB837_00464 [bacterium AB1]
MPNEQELNQQNQSNIQSNENLVDTNDVSNRSQNESIDFAWSSVTDCLRSQRDENFQLYQHEKNANAHLQHQLQVKNDTFQGLVLYTDSLQEECYKTHYENEGLQKRLHSLNCKYINLKTQLEYERAQTTNVISVLDKQLTNIKKLFLFISFIFFMMLSLITLS